MKKLSLIFFCIINFSIISHAQLNLKGFNRAMELLYDTTLCNKDGVNVEYRKYLKKNTKNINAEVFHVLADTDTLSFSLVKIYKGSRYDYSIAMLETKDEIVYEGRGFVKEPCFLARTFTYENTANEKKTVPMYWSMPCYDYMALNYFKQFCDTLIEYIGASSKFDQTTPNPQ